MKYLLPLALVLVCGTCSAQAQHAPETMPARAAAVPSTTLTITGLGGVTKTLSPAEVGALPHVTVHVHNAHSNAGETYSGVPVRYLLGLVKDASTPQASTNMQVVIAGATDNFHVVLTLCDTNPDCRSGQAIVVDEEDGKPLTREGAFKLILTEDRKPARWAHNLQSLTVKAVAAD